MSIVHYATKKFIAANVLKIAIPQKEQSMKVICQKSIRQKQIGETSARIANGIIMGNQSFLGFVKVFWGKALGSDVIRYGLSLGTVCGVVH
ncbi:hypothetical protein BHK98_02875 [Hornefia porci]|uniref:Uncharacterized protein n=1 Tax=Hornefia porci TaxID=2652292 RepID=A0A1Q9JFY1_9FIRM|nr:hypothetical protein BHK98_02875 [Hornefia porci]